MGYMVVAVVWAAVRHCKAGQQVLGQRCETEPLGLGFGCTVENGDWG